MLTMYIHNDSSGTNDSANYNYKVFVNHDKIAEGRVEGHNRADGWAKLLVKIGQKGEYEHKTNDW